VSTAPTEPERTYTIDELAAAAGLPSRTVRHYQSEGVLPSPRREGRVAVYGPSHLERLGLIGRLQDRGLRLDAIRDVLRRVDRGQLSLQAWLGLDERVRAPWSEDGPVLFSEPELRGRLGDLPPGLLAALLDADLVRRPDAGPSGTHLVPSPGLLDVVLALQRSGIDVATSAGALGLLRKRTRGTADELVNFLMRRTGKGFAGAGTPEDMAEALAALQTNLGPVVELLVAREMERAVRTAFDKGRSRLTPPDRARETGPGDDGR
jgi:DNA-binding transcriptional MerR regulator